MKQKIINHNNHIIKLIPVGENYREFDFKIYSNNRYVYSSAQPKTYRERVLGARKVINTLTNTTIKN